MGGAQQQPTVLGGSAAKDTAAEQDGPAAQDTEGLENAEEEAASAAAAAKATAPSAPVARCPEHTSEADLQQVQWSGDLTWPLIALGTRAMLVKRGNLSSSVFEACWKETYGFPLEFPLFGIENVRDLLGQLHGGAVFMTGRGHGAAVSMVQASNERAFQKERESWSSLVEQGWDGSASAWETSRLQNALRAVQKSLGERRHAQKEADAQAKKIGQEYKALTSGYSGRTQQQVATKKEMDKQEQRVAKFKAEAEELEAKEHELQAKIAKASQRPAPQRSDVVRKPAAPPSPMLPMEKEPQTGVDRGRSDSYAASAQDIEDDFM